MRLQSSALQALIFITMLTTLHMVNCRFISTTIFEDDQATQRVLTLSLSRRLSSSISRFEELSNYKVGDPVYGVSNEVVPGGPNPLHN